MPRSEVIYFRDNADRVPVYEWLKQLKARDYQAFARCMIQVQRLQEAGHELRRPTADYLRDGIYELRSKTGRVNFRILYFFHGRNICVLAHAITKEATIPKRDMDLALERKAIFEADPAAHTSREKP